MEPMNVCFDCGAEDSLDLTTTEYKTMINNKTPITIKEVPIIMCVCCGSSWFDSNGNDFIEKELENNGHVFRKRARKAEGTSL